MRTNYCFDAEAHAASRNSHLHFEASAPSPLRTARSSHHNEFSRTSMGDKEQIQKRGNSPCNPYENTRVGATATRREEIRASGLLAELREIVHIHDSDGAEDESEMQGGVGGGPISIAGSARRDVEGFSTRIEESVSNSDGEYIGHIICLPRYLLNDHTVVPNGIRERQYLNISLRYGSNPDCYR